MAKKGKKYKQTYKEGSEEYQVELGKVIYQKCQKLLNMWESENPKGVAEVRAFFEHEISTDAEATYKLLADSPEEALEVVEKACHYRQGSKQHESAMRDLVVLFSHGEVPTAEEMRDIAEAMQESEVYESPETDFISIDEEDIPDEFL